MPSSHHDCGDDAAAYVLGALEPQEAADFRRHLTTCSICQDEVASFEQATSALAMAVPQMSPPRGLKTEIVKAAKAEPKPAARGAAARTRIRRSWLPRLSFPAPRVAGAAGLAVIAAATVVGIEASRGPSPHVIQAQVVGVPGRAEVRVNGAHAELVVQRFPAPPRGRIYEVWLQRGHGAPSPTKALFSVTASGSAEIGVPGNLSGVSTIMVTAEPQGGSLHPTRPPVIVARV